MKKLISICFFTLALFLLSNNGFADILKDLQSFQNSLGDWVNQTNELNKRLSELEDARKAREKQTAELNQNMANIEGLISGLDAKVDKVAKMGSLEGVKDIVKSFEGTLNVFKDRFSKLAKRLEDQEVKTSVLERIYQTAQKPVDTLIQAIDEQKSIINKLAERLGTQENLIRSMEENLKKQISPDESFAKGIEALNNRLSTLESGVLVQKTKETSVHEATKEGKNVEAAGVHHEKTETGEQHAAASDVHHKKTEAKEHRDAAHHETPEEGEHVATAKPHHEEAKAQSVKTDRIEIGDGFFVKSVKFKPFGSSSQISGEIINESDRDFGMTDFKVQAYDNDNVPLGGHGFTIHRFKKGEAEKFEEIIVGVEPEKIVRYSIFPAHMSLVTKTGENAVRMIEKDFKVATTDTEKKEAVPKNLEDLLFDEKTQETSVVTEKLEGFESVGNGFYAGKVSFKGFGSSSTVTGVIKNHSENDFYNASFIIKIYSKSYGMITSLEFSVRRIKGGEEKPFEEIISGVNPVDIDRHEIVFKSSY